MKLDGTHQFQAPRERVYKALIDPEVLQRCIPGCERLERTSDNTFAATIRVGIGAIKGVFDGNVRLEDLREPEHFRIVVDGKGAPGFLKGAGDLNLEQEGPITTITYAGDVQVGGTLASVGQRMLMATAKMMAAQFFTNLHGETQTDVQKPRYQQGFFRTALSWLSGFLKHFFGKQERTR